MQISALIIGLALFTAAFVFVTRPFWEKRPNHVKDSAPTKQTHEPHEATLAAIRDLAFDYKTDKVSVEDYQPLRAQLLVQAAKFMEEQKQEEQQLEALIHSRRKTTHTKCEHCGAPMDTGQKFCSKCGNESTSSMCPSCGKKIHTGDTFCSSCGTKVEIQMKAAASS